MDDISQIVETHLPINIPGIEGLFIPGKTRGHVLKIIGDGTALVRWEVIGQFLMVLNERLQFCYVRPLDSAGNKDVPLI